LNSLNIDASAITSHTFGINKKRGISGLGLVYGV